MDLSSIEAIPWINLQTAYGSAENATYSLRALANGNDDEIEEAIYGFLHSESCHQYTTYTCTPFVVQCVLAILQSIEFKTHHLCEILGFIDACTYGARQDSTLKREVLLGAACYERFTTSKDTKVSAIAKKLLQYCKENG